MTRFSSKPIYLQLRDRLIERIASGDWKPGNALPSELDLAREFQVAPGTMRKALDLMEAMRLLTRHQGRGTFVNDQANLTLLRRYQKLRKDNRVITDDTVEIVSISEAAAGELQCAKLKLSQDDQVIRVCRVRRAAGDVYAVEELWLVKALFPHLMTDQHLATGIARLAASCGMLLGVAQERVTVAQAPSFAAAMLDVPTASPVLLLDRFVCALNGPPVEWRLAWCHLDDDAYYLAETT